MTEFADKVCLITGAASGIGRATARVLADAGASILAVDVDEAGLKSLAEETALLGIRPLDVSDPDAVRDVVLELVARAGEIHACLTFAAVVANWGPPDQINDELWTKVLNVNLRGTTDVCRAVLRSMPPGGSIVTCSSIAGGLKPSPSRAPYTAAKAGIVAHTRDLAVAYGPAGIRVNAIIPGFIDTPMSRRLVRGHEEQAEAERGRIPLRRIGTAHEVAKAAGFLVSDASSYITGTTLVVDGGLSLA
ncbi:SDR family NAD(P)-dependent oxidoreductase [Streptomyces sp. NPDC003860]